MLALGTLAGVLVAIRLAKKDGVKADTIIDLGFWTVISGIAGAKLWFIVQNWGEFSDKWDLVVNFRSGLVFYGGLLGAAAAAIIYVRVKRLQVLKTLDIIAPTAALGLAFGRIGCFLNGCCYGRLTTSAIGMHFPKVLSGGEIVGSPVFVDQLNRAQPLVTTQDVVSQAVIPSQLIGSAGALVVFALMLLSRRWRKYYGEQTALLFILYPVARFIVEATRGDNSPVLWGLTVPQVFSIMAFVLALAGLVALRTARPRSLEISPA